MVVADWELDRETWAYAADGRHAVSVSPCPGMDSPLWYVYLHGPGGRALVDSSPSLTGAWQRGESIANCLGVFGHPWWTIGSPVWKQADEREKTYKRVYSLAVSNGGDHLLAKAEAAEAAGMPCALGARHVAERYGRNQRR